MDYSRNSQLVSLVQGALKEDIGRLDITTKLAVPEGEYVKAVLLAKENCVACGIKIASLVFRLRDETVKFKPAASDGDYIKRGGIIAKLEGSARSILTAERVALNFLTLLSGIATKTRQYVNRVRPYKVKIMDTRKTIPGLRAQEKYAVMVGGGFNHRLKLDEMVLVKDNHLKAASRMRGISGPGDIVKAVRKRMPRGMKLEIEVNNLKEFRVALESGPDIIMLDNMKIADIRKAVGILRAAGYPKRNTLLEASGGITLGNVRRFAASGVDLISVGGLTHSLKAIDISLEII